MTVTEKSEVYVLLKGSPVLRGIFVTFCWSSGSIKECGSSVSSRQIMPFSLWSCSVIQTLAQNVWFRGKSLLKIQLILMIHLTDARPPRARAKAREWEGGWMAKLSIECIQDVPLRSSDLFVPTGRRNLNTQSSANILSLSWQCFMWL